MRPAEDPGAQDGGRDATAMRRFVRDRADSLLTALGTTKNEEKVRGFIALVLVGVLIAIVFKPPHGSPELVASIRTLSIAVLAFYFGIHGRTPRRQVERRPRPGQGREKPSAPTEGQR